MNVDNILKQTTEPYLNSRDSNGLLIANLV